MRIVKGWKWGARRRQGTRPWSEGADTVLTITIEHLEVIFRRQPFHTRWSVDTHSKLGASHTTGLSLKQACRMMRREHGRIVARLFAGLEV